MSEALVSIKGLVKSFPIKGGLLSREVASLRAISNVSFEIRRGETLGLVGESGCGKSTLGRCLLRLLEATSGEIFFDGINVRNLGTAELRKLRRRMQIIFQDPYASLNPRMTVEAILGEPLDIHNLCADKSARQKRIFELLDICGLRREAISKYPHEFSGGQRQRICIARALAVDPEFIVCDEPVSALDVSIQAQIINLMQDLQKEFKLTYLFISHDLRVVEHVSNRVAVMYLGRIVEIAEADQLYAHPSHPYTRALLSAIPVPDSRFRKERVILRGDVPSPILPPPGCHFHPRCPVARDLCRVDVPTLKNVVDGVDQFHKTACHYCDEASGASG